VRRRDIGIAGKFKRATVFLSVPISSVTGSPALWQIRPHSGPNVPSHISPAQAQNISQTRHTMYANSSSQRNLPSRGLFRPIPLLVGASVLMTYGWYKLIKGIREEKYLSPPPVQLWWLKY
jgi:hypothetical protein